MHGGSARNGQLACRKEPRAKHPVSSFPGSFRRGLAAPTLKGGSSPCSKHTNLAPERVSDEPGVGIPPTAATQHTDSLLLPAHAPAFRSHNETTTPLWWSHTPCRPPPLLPRPSAPHLLLLSPCESFVGGLYESGHNRQYPRASIPQVPSTPPPQSVLTCSAWPPPSPAGPEPWEHRHLLGTQCLAPFLSAWPRSPPRPPALLRTSAPTCPLCPELVPSAQSLSLLSAWALCLGPAFSWEHRHPLALAPSHA